MQRRALVGASSADREQPLAVARHEHRLSVDLDTRRRPVGQLLERAHRDPPVGHVGEA
jgi:hypothetical protein